MSIKATRLQRNIETDIFSLRKEVGKVFYILSEKPEKLDSATFCGNLAYLSNLLSKLRKRSKWANYVRVTSICAKSNRKRQN